MMIVDLYRTAFGDDNDQRVQDLYGQILAFSISHHAKGIRVYGHYAIQTEDRLEYRCCHIFQDEDELPLWWSYC